MHPALDRLLDRPERLAVGLMSGTSLDGVDAAVVRISGTGRALAVETLAFESTPYESELRVALRRVAEDEASGAGELALLGVVLAHRFADAAEAALSRAGLSGADVDVVGSHGHTVRHLPDPTATGGATARATLQIGDPATLAGRLGAPVVADFRAADVAAGGQGAPLVPYMDYALWASDTETRGMLNLGGIANLTVIPAGAAPEDVIAFDTGPANMVVDAIAARRLGTECDRDGAGAAGGGVDEDVLRRLMADPYFAQPPPKSTGRERFGSAFVEALVAGGPAGTADLLATATAFTVRSVAEAYYTFVAPRHRIERLVVSGGGVHNRTMMAGLAEAFAPAPVETTAAWGVDPDAKEAVLFAILAHEWANGAPTNMPSVTGAAGPVMLGSLTLPGSELTVDGRR